ncbi:Serine/threonine-protein kinase PknD [compost metagenome]
MPVNARNSDVLEALSNRRGYSTILSQSLLMLPLAIAACTVNVTTPVNGITDDHTGTRSTQTPSGSVLVPTSSPSPSPSPTPSPTATPSLGASALPTPNPTPTATPIQATHLSSLVSTFAGTGVAGYANGSATTAKFYYPGGIAVDEKGNVFVADSGNNRIRKIDANGLVSNLAGDGGRGLVNGNGPSAQFANPMGIGVDTLGQVFIGDQGNDTIRKIDTLGNVSSFAGTDGGYYGSSLTGLAVRVGPVVYVADEYQHVIFKTSSNYWLGGSDVLAGIRWISGLVDGAGSMAKFKKPGGIALGPDGYLYVADTGNNLIRKVSSTGVVSILAGNGLPGFVDGSGNAVQFNSPVGVAVDSIGNVFVADSGNRCVRKISTSGEVATLAGSGSYGHSDDIGSKATFENPTGIAVDKNGIVYVVDRFNHKIRKIVQR